MAVRRQLADAGVPPDDVPEYWLAAVTAALTKWIESSPNGTAFAMNLLGLQPYAARSDKTYILTDTYNRRDIEEVDFRAVSFFYGCRVDNKPVMAPLKVREEEKKLESCDCCGVSAHCTKNFRNPSRDSIETMCNYCVSFHEHPKIRDEGDIQICNSCEKLSCPNHPNQERQKVFG